MAIPDFKAWPKTTRLFDRETGEGPICIITEKIDGTNALVYIQDGEVLAGSRSKWISPKQDNHGFAAWVEANKEELLKLGNGYHYGEWAGAKINRAYGLKERKLYLFPPMRYESLELPSCVELVPVLHRCQLGELIDELEAIEFRMRERYSEINKDFNRPEGLMVEIPSLGLRRKIVWDK